MSDEFRNVIRIGEFAENRHSGLSGILLFQYVKKTADSGQAGMTTFYELVNNWLQDYFLFSCPPFLLEYGHTVTQKPQFGLPSRLCLSCLSAEHFSYATIFFLGSLRDQ